MARLRCYLGHVRSDFFGRNDSCHREAVADSLGHDDHVWDNIVRFISPVVRSAATKASLNFISDTDASHRSDLFINTFQVSFRVHV